jgi:hypothetical protein
MDPERRAWLESALNSAFDGQEDPNQVMKRAVVEIQKGRFSSGLDLLEHVSDFPDCAENVELLGGLKELVALVWNSDPSVVGRTLSVLNLYLPNNPKIQLAAALKHECLRALKAAVAANRDNAVIITLCVACIGNLVRSVTALENSFVRDGGITYLCELAAGSSVQSAVSKVVNLIFALRERCESSSDVDRVVVLVERIYDGVSFDRKDIQLFESTAQLVVALKLGNRVGTQLKSRMSWIESQDPAAVGDYTTETDFIRTALGIE